MTPTSLKRLRSRLGVSQAKLAALLAMSPNTVARMERGEMAIQPPTARLLLLVAHLSEKGDDYAKTLAGIDGERKRERRRGQ